MMQQQQHDSQLLFSDYEFHYMNSTVAATTLVFSSLAILLTLAFCAFNVKYRNFRLIKMSSPNINNIINFNCFMLYMCPILNTIRGLNTTDELLATTSCTLISWILPISSTAIYAAMLAKAWRIFKIFETTPRLHKVVITDVRLALFILALVLLDVVVVAAWHLADRIEVRPRYSLATVDAMLEERAGTGRAGGAGASAVTSDSVVADAASNKLFWWPASYVAPLLANQHRQQPPPQQYQQPSGLQARRPFVHSATGETTHIDFAQFTASAVNLSNYYYAATEEVIRPSNMSSGVVDEQQQEQQQRNIKSGSSNGVDGHRLRLLLTLECDSRYDEVWIAMFTTYKMALLMYGVYLAWLIRHVAVPSMNDAKYLLLSTYAIVVCGLGSMTLTLLLRDWPDMAHTLFALGLGMATAITQCLLFVPKIRLWYKRRNDDNFKISLSQIFLQSSSSCYFMSDKRNNVVGNANSSNNNKNINNNINNRGGDCEITGPNLFNLEDELCELLQENSQLKSFLREKEDVIRVLHEKIKTAQISLFHINERTLDAAAAAAAAASAANFMPPQQRQLDSDCVAESMSRFCTAENKVSLSSHRPNHDRVSCQLEAPPPPPPLPPSQPALPMSLSAEQQQLRSDLDEVEALTSRVRDSIAIDLGSTRHYSPLLYYYRQQLELARSIQGTYNIQCKFLFDAVRLMQQCLRDYCQTVHNPEYLTIESLVSHTHQAAPKTPPATTVETAATAAATAAREAEHELPLDCWQHSQEQATHTRSSSSSDRMRATSRAQAQAAAHKAASNSLIESILSRHKLKKSLFLSTTTLTTTTTTTTTSTNAAAGAAAAATIAKNDADSNENNNVDESNSSQISTLSETYDCTIVPSHSNVIDCCDNNNISTVDHSRHNLHYSNQMLSGADTTYCDQLNKRDSCYAANVVSDSETRTHLAAEIDKKQTYV